MEYIRVTKENIEKEHICCAISSNKDIQVISKKNWLKERFDDGLVFLKSIERGKCFIEYIPAENAWNPIIAEGYMYIDCLWVAGSFKGNDYSNDLLNACIEDSKERLYQLEEVIEELPFMRISKSMIVNIEKILHISPALGGRFEAVLENDEKVIISRLYVPILKNKLGVSR